MNESDDAQLLRQAASGSREALEQIARRYLAFVYHAALRQVREPQMAADVTQAVFVILVSKIRSIKSGTVLHAWLFNTTRYAAANALKMQARRQFHERKAAAMLKHEPQSKMSPREAVEPLLDEALSRLRETDRAAVLLSYFGGNSWREVASLIGTSEEAARKRVERAVSQMRQFFARRGAEVTPATIVGVMAASSKASVPAHLVESIGCSITAAPSAAAINGIAQGVLHMMTLMKIKLAATFALSAMVLTLSGAGAVLLAQHRDAAAPADPEPAVVVSLDDGVVVEFLGVNARSSPQQWWKPDGSPAVAVQVDDDWNSQSTHQMVVRVLGDGVDDMGLRWTSGDDTGFSTRIGNDIPNCTQIGFRPADGQPSVNLRLEVAAGEWQTVAVKEGPSGLAVRNSVVLSECIEADDGTYITVTDGRADDQVRILAVTADGAFHDGTKMMMGMSETTRQTTVRFSLPADEIDRIEFQARPFDQFIEFKNVSVEPGKSADFKVESGVIERKTAQEPDDVKR